MVEDSSPSCHGADVMHNGRLYKDVVELISVELVVKIRLKAEEKPSGRVWGKKNTALLPCGLSNRECVLGSSTKDAHPNLSLRTDPLLFNHNLQRSVYQARYV